MGVDISISPHSLAQCAEAKCKNYRPHANTPVLPMDGRRKYQVYRSKYLFPIESIVLPIRTCNGVFIEPQTATVSRYAVEITTLTNRRKKVSYFHRWLTLDEYEQLKVTHLHRLNSRRLFYGLWHEVDFHEKKQICNLCLVRVGAWSDCQPRLFGYSMLPEIRKGATFFFLTPPSFIRPEVAALVSDFADLFPEHVYTDTRNIADASEQHFRHSIEEYKDKGYKVIIGEMTPSDVEKYSKIADTIINRLIFRDTDNDETFWLHGEQLEALVNWLNRFMQILSMIVEAEILTDEEKSVLRSFAGVMLTFTDAHRNALKYNLTIGTSW